MSSKLTLILKGSGLRILQTFSSILIGILMMPFLMKTLGTELYGLWILIGSIVASYYLLDLGFNQAVTRYVSKYIHQNNPQAANKTINTALLIYSILGLVVLLASILAATFGTERLMQASANIGLAKTILIITGLALALEFPAKAFTGIISAYMRYDFIAIVRLIKSIVDALLIYWFLTHGYGVVAMALILFTTEIISTICFIKFTTSLFKELKISPKEIDFSTFKDVFHFSKWVFVIDISGLLRDKMDIWFIAYYVNSGALAIYYVAVRLIEYALQFLTQATGITGPIFTESYAKGEVEKLRKAVIFFIKLNIALGCLVLIGFYLVGQSFIDLWMKGAIPAREAFVCLMILACGRFAVYFTAPINSLLMTYNKHFIGAWVSIAETLGGLVLCWMLIPRFEIIGAACAIAIPYVIGRIIFLPLFAAKYVDIKFLSLVGRVFIFGAVTSAFAISASGFIPRLASLSLIEFAAIVPAIVAIQLVLTLLLWNKEERKTIYTFIQQKISRLINKRFQNA